MSFTKQILVGLALGVVAGLFLGDLVGPLTLVADGFVKLLQMTVLPYVTISIVSSLGGLSYADAKRLGLRSALVLLTLWAIGIIYAFLVPLAFPATETASFFSTTLVARTAPLDFVELYIPSNPFHSLANNIVPAVVLFSVIVGVAMIGVERKRVVLDVLVVAGQALARATRSIVRLTPLGIFAIAASTAGTLDLQQLERLQVYLLAYMAVAALVALWVLPGLVAAVTPFRYSEVILPSRDALITAFMAGDLFIVLPTLVAGCEKVIASHGLSDRESTSLPDLLIPTSFNFPHTGKLLSLSFVLFAGWVAGTSLDWHAYPALAATGLLTFFGSLNAAIPFLLDLFRIPSDTFHLFLATGVINSRFGTLVAAVHLIVIALVGTAAVVGAVRFDVRRIARYVTVTVVLTAATLGGLRAIFSTVLKEEFRGRELIMTRAPRFAHPPSVVRTDAPPASSDATSTIDAVRTRGHLRVAVLSRMPYAFRNDRGDLVGFDIEMAHQLARDLEVGLEFVETNVDNLPALLAERHCDIAMAGFLVTPRRAELMRFSQPYIDETLAFMVKDHLRSEFTSWNAIRRLGHFAVGAVNVPYYLAEVRDRAPQLDLQDVPADVDPAAELPQFDAFVVPAERGSIFTLLHPQFSIVVPEPDPVKVPLAYPLTPHDSDWASLVNNWIELKRRDGTLDALYRHWILGESPERQHRRWSIIRNVLHWVE
jgi:Na+/H+-dicarboxylate symporter/ABC-type amino acid transport substrate-binding protein